MSQGFSPEKLYIILPVVHPNTKTTQLQVGT
jgi:hypothetical protein